VGASVEELAGLRVRRQRGGDVFGEVAAVRSVAFDRDFDVVPSRDASVAQPRGAEQ
jgi:hypothetical protein